MLADRRVIQLLLLALGSVAQCAAQECFELPVLIVTPLYRNFPTSNCPQKPHPSEDCMKEPIASTLDVIDHQDGRANCLNDAPTSVLSGVIHYRGQSSLYWNKHQFAVNLNTSAPFLEMPSDHKFIVNGPFMDGSMLRNHMGHWLFRQTGRYSPRSRHLVVFYRGIPEATDGKPFYKGIHLLMEDIAYGPNRVGLAQLNKDCNVNEFSGGWAWENNPLHFGDYSPNLVNDQYFGMFGFGERPVLKYPSGKDLTQKMRDYFIDSTTGPLPQLYKNLYENMKKPDELEKYLDIGSFVDYFLHTEMAMNQDAYRRSAYFFKDRNEPINAGPVWDLNLAYGSGAIRNADFGWSYGHMFWKRLTCNYKFVSLLNSRWRALRQGPWSDDTIAKFIDDSASPLARQLAKCSDTWQSDGMYCANVAGGNRRSYQHQIDYLKTIVLARAKWMDSKMTSFYMQLNTTICGYVGELPKYNCAPNGDDDGCLTNPEQYIQAVPFPPLHQPFKGKECQLGANPTGEEATIDHCWLSAGVENGILPFCSGFGRCDGGPGAVCQCINGVNTSSCLPPAEDEAEKKKEHNHQSTRSPIDVASASSPQISTPTPVAAPPPTPSASTKPKSQAPSTQMHKQTLPAREQNNTKSLQLFTFLCLLLVAAVAGWYYNKRLRTAKSHEYMKIPLNLNEEAPGSRSRYGT